MQFRQLTLDAYLDNRFHIGDRPIRLIELFAGIGSQYSALKSIGANVEHWKAIEFDKYACNSYNAIHGTNIVPTDIQDVRGEDLQIIDTDKYVYLLTYSFPCTDLSVAGNMLGMSKGSGTRSGLLWQVERLLNECDDLPQILVMENVPQVHGTRNLADWEKWLSFLEGKGYSNFWKDLNAKDFGVAQSRNRCFCVSILGDWTYKFPEPQKLEKVMKDYLEDEVDEKYYITNEKARDLIERLIEDGTIEDEIGDTIHRLG